MLHAASTDTHPAQLVRDGLGAVQAAFPYLEGHLEPLVRLCADAPDRVVGELFGVLADVPLGDVTEAASGDLLGVLYMNLIAPGDRAGRGAFYTPPHVAYLMAGLASVQEGDRFHEPCVGCGGLVVSTIREMRSRGARPETVSWVIGDLDRLALACAGIQVAAHGMPDVTLVPGDALEHALPA